jgi:hypothetical protein
MTPWKKERKSKRRIGMRRNCSKQLAAAEKVAERLYSGPELPVTIGSTFLGYLVFVAVGPPGFEALTPEKASLGMFSDAIPAICAIFEQLFPESKSI